MSARIICIALIVILMSACYSLPENNDAKKGLLVMATPDYFRLPVYVQYTGSGPTITENVEVRFSSEDQQSPPFMMRIKGKGYKNMPPPSGPVWDKEEYYFAQVFEGSYTIERIEVITQYSKFQIIPSYKIGGFTVPAVYADPEDTREFLKEFSTDTFKIKAGMVTVLPFDAVNGKLLTSERIENILHAISDYRNAEGWDL